MRSPTHQLPPPHSSDIVGPQRASPTSRKVSFGASSPAAPKQQASPGKAAAAAAAAASCADTHFNQLFSPGLARQDSWTIEAQRSDRPRMAEPGSSGSAAAAAAAGECSPAASSLPGAFTPASAGYLESARKVDDLQGRLESLEAALREMESKAVAQLDRSLQDKVLATAAKIVQKRFLADKELDRKLQQQILQTAIKVVNRRQSAAPAGQGAAPRAQSRQEAEADPTRRLEFEQGEPAVDAQVQAFVAHIEQGLGEVLRRLEKKVDAVASLLDQNALELLESRMAGGLVKLESRLAAVEDAAASRQAQQPAAEDSSQRLLARVAAMTEQSRAVTDLLAALGAQGSAASQQVAAAVAAVQVAAAGSAVPPQDAACKPAAEQAAVAGGEQPPPPAELAAPLQQEQEPAPPAAQLVQRRAAAARKSVLGDPGRTAAAGSSGSGTAVVAPGPRRPALLRLKPTHAAGTAQQIAIATAREQLAKQAARAREEAEADSPAFLTALYVFGWGLLVLLGLSAALMGMVAALMRTGRLTEADLAFLWERPAGR
ncbi:hypothetical protein ABPG75_008165 [Micractinium tetrahymenae]